MTDETTVAEYLIRADGQSYCDPCLSKALDVPLPRLEHAVTALAHAGTVKRVQGPCATCGETQLVTRRCMSAFAA